MPTKIYFGEEALNYLNTKLPKYGDNVVLIYGGDPLKRTGSMIIYDPVGDRMLFGSDCVKMFDLFKVRNKFECLFCTFFLYFAIIAEESENIRQ